MSDHYERLGVSFGASRDEIRVAYRRLAREHHPDRSGDSSAERMAQINEAWRVLSDPARRAVYDAQSRGNSSQRSGSAGFGSAAGSANSANSAGSTTATTATADRQRGTASGSFTERHATPATFPWRFMLGVVLAGVAFVLVNAALTKQGTEPAPDNLMEVGSCVEILDNGDAKEVLCSGPHDGLVADLRPVESICPQRTELHRDRQGMGDICIRLVEG